MTRPPFHYQRRTADVWEKRGERQGYEGFVRDDFRMYRPKIGDNAIRILPATFDNAQHYGLDVFVHYGIGADAASVLCLNRMKRQPCPVCEARARLPADDEDGLRALRPVKRVLVWLLDKNDRESNAAPLVWGIPETLDTDICKIARDRRSGAVREIDHPEDGYDVYFTKEGEGVRTKYKAPQISHTPNAVPDKALSYVEDYPLTDVLHWRDYHEIERLFASGGEDYGQLPRGGDRTARPARDERSSRRSRDDNNGARDDERPTRRVEADDYEPPSRRARDDVPRRRDRDADDDRPARARDDDPPAGRDDDYDDPPSRAREREAPERVRTAPEDRIDRREAPAEEAAGRPRGGEDDGNGRRRRDAEPEEAVTPSRGRRDAEPEDDTASIPRARAMREHLNTRR